MAGIGDMLTRPLSLDNFGSKAVYNANGVQIGYYDTLENLANGVIHYTVKAGGSVDAPSTWQMNGGALAIRQPVSKYLLSQNIQPTWPFPKSIEKAVAAKNDPYGWDDLGADATTTWDNAIGALPTFDLGFDFSGQTIDATKLGTYVLWGGLGLLGLIVILKKA